MKKGFIVTNITPSVDQGSNESTITKVGDR